MAIADVMSELMVYNKDKREISELPGLVGVESIFNKYSLFSLSSVNLTSMSGAFMSKTNTWSVDRLFDIDPESNPYLSDGVEPSSLYDKVTNPTAKVIIDHARDVSLAKTALFGPMPYSWSDFLYCKYYGEVPNNRLITLRRYPLPTFDSGVAANQHPMPPLAQAVTWFSEDTGNKLNDVLKFAFSLAWEDIEAKVQDVAGNEKGFGVGAEALGGLGKAGIEAAGGIIGFMRGDSKRWSGEALAEQNWEKNAFNADGPYWNQVLGPVNVVNHNTMRKPGLNFSNDITLVFEYKLTSINGVNPRTAMIDLITNFLTLTYNNAKFWGGAYRYFPSLNDSVKFFGSQEKFYKGDWDGYFDSASAEYTSMFSNASASMKGMLSDPKKLLDKLGDIAGKVGDMIMGKLASKSRPAILSIRSALTGDPIGEWHLVVGNPLKPIACIGNLYVSNTTMQFNETLGADDFPTEVKFTVTLKHGRPRDKGDIESMFNYGNGRLTYAPLLKTPSEKGTFGDAYQNGSFNDAPVLDANKKINQPATVARSQAAAGLKNDKTSPGRIKSRLTNDWGAQFATDNLMLILDATKIKF